MDLFITELVNKTDKTIGFESMDGNDYLRMEDVPPHTKGRVLQSLTLGNLMRLDHYRDQYRVLMDGKSTGKKLYVYHMLKAVRMVFAFVDGVLLVHGAYENCLMDDLLRLRGIGPLFGRDRIWDKKPLFDFAFDDDDPEEGRETNLSKRKKRQIHIHFHMFSVSFRSSSTP